MSNRAKKVHRGVRIFAEKLPIAGSDLHENKDGSMSPRKLKYDTYYHYTDGYRCDSVSECIESIDKLWVLLDFDDTPRGRSGFMDVMNNN